MANVADSGIQSLNLDQKHASSQKPTSHMFTVRTLDHGNILATLPASRRHIVLLETATMSELHTISAPDSNGMPLSPVVLCASLKSSLAVYYFKGGGVEISCSCGSFTTINRSGLPIAVGWWGFTFRCPPRDLPQ